jgi:hypothetical protein
VDVAHLSCDEDATALHGNDVYHPVRRAGECDYVVRQARAFRPKSTSFLDALACAAAPGGQSGLPFAHDLDQIRFGALHHSPPQAWLGHPFPLDCEERENGGTPSDAAWR